MIVLSANSLQAINDGIDDGTLSDIEESTKSKYYEYDTDWESSREGLLLEYCVTYLIFCLECFDTGTAFVFVIWLEYLRPPRKKAS